MQTENETKRIRVASHGGDDGGISLKGFSPENLEKMLAAMTSGAYFVRVEKGELVAVPIWEKLPDPIEDKTMAPFWRKPETNINPVDYEENYLSKEKFSSASISIQHLCGHNYSENGYKNEAQKLESYGFECMRSRRSTDGEFWEIWFLPGLWFAKGYLGKRLKKITDEEKRLEIALEILRQSVSFGTLDVSVQRLGMASPD